MAEWKKLNVIGPECEINRKGHIRQKVMVRSGKVLYDVIRKPTMHPSGFLYIQFREGILKQQNKYIHKLLAESFPLAAKNK
jgi:hypothetical protein